MVVTVVALISVNESEPEALAAYLSAAQPLLDEVGGRIVSRFTLDDMKVGERFAESVLIVEYPDRDAVERLFASDAYAALSELRDKAFTTYRVSIASNA